MHVLDCFIIQLSLISAVMIVIPWSTLTGPIEESRMFPSPSQRIDLPYFSVRPDIDTMIYVSKPSQL